MERVSVESIDYEDRTFCISYPLPDDRLLSSIRQFGILSPLILLGPAPFRVVTGFRRLHAARCLGITEIPCAIGDMGPREALLLAIHDNSARPLNLIEKALIVEKVTAAEWAKGDSDAAIRAIGLQPHEKVIGFYRQLAGGEETLRAFVAGRNVGAFEAGLLLAMDPELRSRLISLLASIRLTSSLLREIVELARLVSIKTGSLPFMELEGLTSGDAVKSALRRCAYPLLTGLEERLDALKEAMHLPTWISVATDPYFEKSEVAIRMTIRTSSDLGDGLERLQLLADEGLIRSILDLIGTRTSRD